MNWKNILTTLEHGLAGVLLVSIPVLLNAIPENISTMTLGGILGLLWGLVRNYLSASVL